MKREKIKWLLFFLFVFACLGYFREFFFVNMNNLMFMKYYNRTATMRVPEVMRFFERFSYDTLYYSKYLFTIAGVIVFYFANYFALKKLSSAVFFRRILLYAYCVMFLIAALSMGYGYLVHGNLQSDEYTLSRWLIGVAQSPIISLILLASEKLYNKQTS